MGEICKLCQKEDQDWVCHICDYTAKIHWDFSAQHTTAQCLRVLTNRIQKLTEEVKELRKIVYNVFLRVGGVRSPRWPHKPIY